MKKISIVLLLMFPFYTFSQTTFTTLKEAKEATGDGLKTASGWIIKEGDKIDIGTGSTGNKKFAYIYIAPGISLNTSREPLPPAWANKKATVKKITFSGMKRTGFTPVLVVGVGLLSNYHVDIDNAIDAGEIVPPAEYAKKEVVAAAPNSSIADELKKLKELLDSGALTQEEYDTQKKKLLAQ